MRKSYLNFQFALYKIYYFSILITVYGNLLFLFSYFLFFSFIISILTYNDMYNDVYIMDMKIKNILQTIKIKGY